jgi:8-oxo-dGTP pyrophosphatase MutT (NUDIX family)
MENRNEWKKSMTPLRPAAVLVPLITRKNGLTVMLTRRNEQLKNHAGQISFPGGSVDDNDRNPTHTALRETEEEIGLDPDCIKIIGSLDEYIVGTGYLVNPIIGSVKPPFKLIRQEDEVSEIFEVPLDYLIQPTNFERYSRYFNGKMRHHLAIKWKDYFIWGATAGILRNLSQRLQTS